MATLLFYDPIFLAHNPGPSHPERKERLEAIVEGLVPLPGGVRMRAPSRRAEERELLRVHEEDYVEAILRLRGESGFLDRDTFISPGSVDAAVLAAGAGVELVGEVLSGRVENGFGLVRPPGHHAEADRAMGFCVFNNVAVAAAEAISQGIKRVLIVDWDVHHGNGTQNIFYDRRDVLFFSAHQFPFYPGTGDFDERGAGEGEGYTINVPLHLGCGDADYGCALKEILVPAAAAYRPELVLVSAGFDAADGDPLASMHVSTRGFSAMCGLVRDIAEEYAEGRLILMLEGGYDARALAKNVRACAEVLGGAPAPGFGDAAPSVATKEDVLKILSNWRPPAAF